MPSEALPAMLRNALLECPPPPTSGTVRPSSPYCLTSSAVSASEPVSTMASGLSAASFVRSGRNSLASRRYDSLPTTWAPPNFLR